MVFLSRIVGVGIAAGVTVDDARKSKAQLIEELEVLRWRVRRHQASIEKSPIAVFVADAEGNYVEANAAASDLLGYSTEALLKLSLRDLLPDEVRGRGLPNFSRLKEVGQVSVEMALRRKDGSQVQVAITAVALAPDRFIAFVEDISERKQAEEKVAHFALLLERSLSEIFTFDTETLKFVDVNYGARKNLQYSMEELRQLTPLDLKPEITAEAFAELLAPLRAGQEQQIRFCTVHRRRDGTLYPVEVHLQLMRDASLFVAMIRDITEREQRAKEHEKLEEQLRQAQKMEAVGRLAGGVAHDFNNILCAIAGNAELALYDLDAGDPAYGPMKEIAEAAGRGADLTRQLLAFSRKQIVEPKVLDLGALINRLEPMLRRLIGEHITLRVAGERASGRIRADPGQIEQMVLNLVLNARDAMPDGGVLRIVTADVLAEEGGTGEPSPGEVVLEVCDSGCGMDAETRARVFEPFFTTKELGQGTGLGLATVFGIAEQSGSRIEVRSEPGEGSSFQVYFPRLSGDHELAARPDPVGCSGGLEVVMVVEDEEIVRRMAVQILERLGYTVLAASSGAEALALAARYDGAIDLLLTDVVMPGMNGRELATRLAEQRPAIKVLFTSGYTQDVIAHHGVLDAGLRFIGKPYTLATLSAKVRAALDD